MASGFTVQSCANGPSLHQHGTGSTSAAAAAAAAAAVLTGVTSGIGTPNGYANGSLTSQSAYSECYDLLAEALKLSRSARQRELIRECIERLKRISDAQEEKIKLLETTNHLNSHQDTGNGPNSSYRGALPTTVELNYFPDYGFQIAQPATIHYQDHGSNQTIPLQIAHDLGDRITLVSADGLTQNIVRTSQHQNTFHLQPTTIASSNVLTLPTPVSTPSTPISSTGNQPKGRKRRLLQQHQQEQLLQQQQQQQQQQQLLQQHQQQQQEQLIQHQLQQDQRHPEQIHLAVYDNVHVQIQQPNPSIIPKQNQINIQPHLALQPIPSPIITPTPKPKSKRSLDEVNSTRKMRKSRAIPEEYLNATDSAADYDIIEDCKDKYQSLRDRLGNEKVNAVLIDLKNGSMKVMLSLGLVIRGPTRHNGMEIPPTSYACNFDQNAECARKVFVHNLSFLRHVCVDHFDDVKPHRCPQCPYRSYLRQQLNNHFAQHSKQARYYCDREGCEYFTNIKGQYIKHMDNHEGFKRFRCTVEGCTNAYTTRKNLREHMNVHKGVRPHVCKTCGAKFFRKATLFQHKRNHKKPFACEIPGCEYRTGVPQNLSAHMVHQHQFPSDKPPKPKKELTPEQRQRRLQYQKTKRYFCTFEGCTQGFTGKNKLDDHMRIHTNEKPFICETCGKCFRRRYALKKHQVSKHTTARDKPFYCASCDLGFFLQHHLERHNESKRHRMMVEVGASGTKPFNSGPLIQRDSLPDQILSHPAPLTVPVQKPRRAPIKKLKTIIPVSAAEGYFELNDPSFAQAFNQTFNQVETKKPAKRKTANKNASVKSAAPKAAKGSKIQNPPKKQKKARKQNTTFMLEEFEPEPFSEEESEEDDESEVTESDVYDSESETEIAEARRKLIAAALMRSRGNAAAANSVPPKKAPKKGAKRRGKQPATSSSAPLIAAAGFNPGEVHVIELHPDMALNGPGGVGHLVSSQDGVHLTVEDIKQEIGAEVTLAGTSPIHIQEASQEIMTSHDNGDMDDHDSRDDDSEVVLGVDGSVHLHHSNAGSILTQGTLTEDEEDAISHAISLGKQAASSSLVHSVAVSFSTPTLNNSVPNQLLLSASSASSKNHPHLDDDFGTFVEYYTDAEHQGSLSDSLRSPEHHL